MIKTPHPLKLRGLAIAAVILVVLLLGTESWPMRVALLALGAVGALTAVDLPFPQYHLLGALSVTVFGTAAASYVTGGFRRSVVSFSLMGTVIAITYIFVYRKQTHAG